MSLWTGERQCGHTAAGPARGWALASSCASWWWCCAWSCQPAFIHPLNFFLRGCGNKTLLLKLFPHPLTNSETKLVLSRKSSTPAPQLCCHQVAGEGPPWTSPECWESENWRGEMPGTHLVTKENKVLCCWSEFWEEPAFICYFTFTSMLTGGHSAHRITQLSSRLWN